jgi:hypothetical protein
MQKWEYLLVVFYGHTIISINDGNSDYKERVSYFNQLGQEGWELAGISEDTFIFKRPLP